MTDHPPSAPLATPPRHRNRKPLVLHIGLQKTGTSAIQVMLASSAGYLAAAGFTYPALPAPTDANNARIWTSPFRHNIVVATVADFPSTFDRLDPDQDAAFWDGLRQSDAVPILSAEEFSRLGDPAPLALRLAGFDVHLVVYLRRQDAFAESLYNQRNKILLTRAAPRLLAPDLLTEASLFTFLKQEHFIPLLNFDRLLARFTTALTPARTTVRVFDRARLAGGDVCGDFADVLGLDAGRLKLPPRDANGSVANSLLQSLLNRAADSGEAAALTLIADTNAKIAAGVDFSGDYSILSGPTRSAMLRQYADINARIAQDYGVRFD